MTDKIQEILDNARKNAKFDISKDPTPHLNSIPKAIPGSVIEQDKKEWKDAIAPGQILQGNELWDKMREDKANTLSLIDSLFPLDTNIPSGTVPDRTYALLFAEITNYDYERCNMIFNDANLIKEIVDIGLPKLLIYKGLKDGKMGI